jgi:hypothetical protein
MGLRFQPLMLNVLILIFHFYRILSLHRHYLYLTLSTPTIVYLCLVEFFSMVPLLLIQRVSLCAFPVKRADHTRWRSVLSYPKAYLARHQQFPGLTYISAVCISACLTPTDPVSLQNTYLSLCLILAVVVTSGLTNVLVKIRRRKLDQSRHIHISECRSIQTNSIGRMDSYSLAV